MNKAKEILLKTIVKIDGAYAPSTVRAFRADFNSFIDFSEGLNESALPSRPETIANYINYLTEKRFSSSYIRRIIVSIAAVHQINRLTDPTKDPDVRLAMRRMHRTLGRNHHQALGLNKEALERILLAIQTDLRGLRDRALLRVAYDTLSRRSEVVSLRINDIEATRDKDGNETARILLRRSKTDQDLRGRWLYLKPSSYQCLMKWINEAKLKDGLIFRGIKGKSTISKGLCLGQVGRIYKKLARRAGLEASIVNEISSHSTRVGAAQDLLMEGASLPMIMTCGRWSKTDTVMKYIEATTLNMNTF